MKNSELISVVIITYNRYFKDIYRSINSVLNQTYNNIEIILVDDNNPNSKCRYDIEKSIKKMKKIKYIKHDYNMGAQVARNTGIKNSFGKYIAFLDDDDEWMKDKIEQQIKPIKDDVGLVYSMGKIVIEETGDIKDYVTTKKFNSEVTFKDLLYADYIGTTTQALIPKNVFNVVGDFDINQPARQDYEMWLRISKKYKCVGVSKPLFKHYIHAGEQISKNNNKAIIGLKNILKKYKKDYSKNPSAKWHICFLISNRYKRDKKYISCIIYFIEAAYNVLKALLIDRKQFLNRINNKIMR